MSDLPNTPEGTLKLMPSTASEVARFSKSLIEAVKSGNVNPLELTVQLHALTKVYELVREEIEENILKEADKYPEKVIERYGARIEKAEVGVKYDYSTSRDPEWEMLASEAMLFAERKKEREGFLRALKGPFTMLNKDTGQIDDIRPPIKTSKSGIKIYLANVK
jgi:hypothetical protein